MKNTCATDCVAGILNNSGLSSLLSNEFSVGAEQNSVRLTPSSFEGCFAEVSEGLDDGSVFIAGGHEFGAGQFDLDPGSFGGVGADYVASAEGIICGDVIFAEGSGEAADKLFEQRSGAGVVGVSEADMRAFDAGIRGDWGSEGGHSVAVETDPGGVG